MLYKTYRCQREPANAKTVLHSCMDNILAEIKLALSKSVEHRFSDQIMFELYELYSLNRELEYETVQLN